MAIRKIRDPFDLFSFGNFEKIFRKMQEEMMDMDKQFQDTQSLSEEDFEKAFKEGKVKRKVYGFSMSVGPDGKPIVREFGNLPQQQNIKVVKKKEERQPLIDVFEGKEEAVVVAEVPGVEEKEIKLSGDDHLLIIDVKGVQRKYYKEIKFKNTVDRSKLKSTYKNGVLEIRIPIKR